MPNIDTDLFQVLTLALLFLSLLALLAALSLISGIKRRLEEGSAGAANASQPSSSYDYQAPATSYDVTPSAYEPAATSAAYEPVSSYGGSQSATQAQEVSTDFVSMADVTPATDTGSSTSLAGGLRGDEPEEQPFERDGRWWFKRGGELLVYDEGTGQWVAAPAPAAGGGGIAAAPASTTPAYSSESTTAQTSVSPRVDTGEGWKCASCGAVNGSTATTCRMCFATR